jgi:hypothetical protein
MDTHAFEHGITADMTVPSHHCPNGNGVAVVVVQQNDHHPMRDAEAMHDSIASTGVYASNGIASCSNNNNSCEDACNKATVTTSTNGDKVSNDTTTTHATNTTSRSTIQMNGSRSTSNHIDTGDIRNEDETKQLLHPIPPVTTATSTVATTTSSQPSPSLMIASDRVTYTDDTIIANYT